ncbi:hypothetical protein KNR18_08545 [Klebsiella sp. O852]|uniref:hypothetical protein n=1 Tax=Klebsiella sp. O852 TaxID=2718650 RepID=UPI001C02646B|nr:hypothetical protein [Klebsiella sp. O852]MBT9335061.1 hypothetical protein [Klebsiella sp. O852]
MRLINLESHLFSSKELSITEIQVQQYISVFLPLKLYPQVFNETFFDGTLKKQFMFANPLEGKQIMFQQNKISIITSFGEDDIDYAKLETEHNNTIQFLKLILSSFGSVKSDVNFNRLSYVIRYANIRNYEQEIEDLRKNTISTLKWVNPENKPSDFELNLGFKDDVDGEPINNIIKLTQGYYQSYSSFNQQAQRCLIKLVDINTLPDNIQDRFSPEDACETIIKLKNKAHQTALSIENH